MNSRSEREREGEKGSGYESGAGYVTRCTLGVMRLSCIVYMSEECAIDWICIAKKCKIIYASLFEVDAEFQTTLCIAKSILV